MKNEEWRNPGDWYFVLWNQYFRRRARSQPRAAFFIVMWVELLAMTAVAGKPEGLLELSRISRSHLRTLVPQLKGG